MYLKNNNIKPDAALAKAMIAEKTYKEKLSKLEGEYASKIKEADDRLNEAAFKELDI